MAPPAVRLLSASRYHFVLIQAQAAARAILLHLAVSPLIQSPPLLQILMSTSLPMLMAVGKSISNLYMVDLIVHLIVIRSLLLRLILVLSAKAMGHKAHHLLKQAAAPLAASHLIMDLLIMSGH